MNGGQRILVVNRNRRNVELLDRVLGEAGFDTQAVSDLDALDRALADPDRLALALVDITGFDAAIWDRCEYLREIGVPLLLVAPRRSAAVEEAGERHGARNVLVKPLAVKELVTLVGLLAEG